MSLSSIRERHKRPGLLSGRWVALLVILALGGACFALGYYAGSKGAPPKEDITTVVPEGAGVVLLASDEACKERTTLETLPSKNTPEPDAEQKTPEPPVVSEEEPIIERKPAATEAPQKEPVAEKPMTAEPPKQETVTQKAPEPAPKPVTKPKVEPKVERKQPPSKPEKKVIVTQAPEDTAYSVQVGAFNSLEDAQAHKRRFTQKGYKASVYKDDGAPGSAQYKVRIGVYGSRSEAAAAAHKLSEEGVSGFVTPLY